MVASTPSLRLKRFADVSTAGKVMIFSTRCDLVERASSFRTHNCLFSELGENQYNNVIGCAKTVESTHCAFSDGVQKLLLAVLRSRRTNENSLARTRLRVLMDLAWLRNRYYRILRTERI